MDIAFFQNKKNEVLPNSVYMCTIGLVALRSDEVLELMEEEFPSKYKASTRLNV